MCGLSRVSFSFQRVRDKSLVTRARSGVLRAARSVCLWSLVVDLGRHHPRHGARANPCSSRAASLLPRSVPTPTSHLPALSDCFPLSVLCSIHFLPAPLPLHSVHSIPILLALFRPSPLFDILLPPPFARFVSTSRLPIPSLLPYPRSRP
ncbi:hypothetical protein B0H12DRAFT_432820 [Mycena haematopus]|nr:hypothetical protein B0H12DRAFT_432820 [Mycena haematopus]